MTVDTFLPCITLTITLFRFSSDAILNPSTSIVESTLRPLCFDTSVKETIKARTHAPHIMHAFIIKERHSLP
jgi:hypothetical protein